MQGKARGCQHCNEIRHPTTAEPRAVLEMPTFPDPESKDGDADGKSFPSYMQLEGRAAAEHESRAINHRI